MTIVEALIEVDHLEAMIGDDEQGKIDPALRQQLLAASEAYEKLNVRQELRRLYDNASKIRATPDVEARLLEEAAGMTIRLVGAFMVVAASVGRRPGQR